MATKGREKSKKKKKSESHRITKLRWNLADHVLIIKKFKFTHPPIVDFLDYR